MRPLNICIKLLRDCLSIYSEDESILTYPSSAFSEATFEELVEEDENSLLRSWVDSMTDNNVDVDDTNILLDIDARKLLFIPVVGPVRQFRHLRAESVEELSIYFGGMIECNNSVLEDTDSPYILVSSHAVPTISEFRKGVFIQYVLNGTIDLFVWQPLSLLARGKKGPASKFFFPGRSIYAMEPDSDVSSIINILSTSGLKSDLIENILVDDVLDLEYLEHMGVNHVAVDIVLGALQLGDEESVESLEKVFDSDVAGHIKSALDAFQGHYRLSDLVRMWVTNSCFCHAPLPILDSRNIIKMPIRRPTYIESHTCYQKDARFVSFCSGQKGKGVDVDAMVSLIEDSLCLKNGLFWHGTTGVWACNIMNDGIDIDKGEQNRDFGRGF